MGVREDRARRYPHKAVGFGLFVCGDAGEEDDCTWEGGVESEALETPESAAASLAARRDGFNYWVSYEPPSKKDPDIPDDKALVMASVVEGGRPGAFRD